MKTKRHILSQDYWTISKKNEIIIHESVPEDKEILQYLLKSPNKVIEKLNNGKQYFIETYKLEIIYLTNNELSIAENDYELIFERK